MHAVEVWRDHETEGSVWLSCAMPAVCKEERIEGIADELANLFTEDVSGMAGNGMVFVGDEGKYTDILSSRFIKCPFIIS